jgi:hypothetical protein
MKIFPILLALLLLATQGLAEILHIEKFYAIGRGDWKVLVPEIYQSDNGVVVAYVLKGYPGNTYFDKWWVGQYEVSFPTIAITEKIEYSGWNESMEHRDEEVLHRGPYSYYDTSDPTHPTSYDYQRNGGWVNSYTMGWINIKEYPWIWDSKAGWTYIFQGEPVWHEMSWYGYSIEHGWMFLAEGAPGWYYLYLPKEGKNWFKISG